MRKSSPRNAVDLVVLRMFGSGVIVPRRNYLFGVYKKNKALSVKKKETFVLSENVSDDKQVSPAFGGESCLQSRSVVGACW